MMDRVIIVWKLLHQLIDWKNYLCDLMMKHKVCACCLILMICVKFLHAVFLIID